MSSVVSAGGRLACDRPGSAVSPARLGGAGRGQVGQDPPPGGDALAEEHAEPERERPGPCMQGSVTELFVPGVQAAAGSTSLSGIQTPVVVAVWFSSRGAR